MDAWEFAGGEYHLVNVFNTFFLLNSIAKLIMITRPPHSFASLIDFLWPVKNSFQNYWLQLFFEPLFGRQKINFSVRSFHYETFRKDSWDFLLLFILLKEALTFVYFSIFYETKIRIIYILFRGKSVCLEEHAQQRNSTVLCRQQFWWHQYEKTKCWK